SPRVRLWNARDSRLVWEQVPGGQTRVSFTPDGRELIIGRSGDFSFLDVHTFEIKRRFQREVGLFAGEVVFSPDGKLMALELAPGVVHLKEVATARTVAQLRAPLADRSGWMTFGADGTKLFTITSSRSAVHVWDLRAIRSGLKKMGLDWEWPEFPPP